ncbi:MAG: GTP-binding protein [Chitinivibrionales bacterium]|nr:GTP-binding protein [Chitinivibrionales bacterium]
MEPRQQMNIVVVGHVDHGKSTVIGRLLADTGSLPQGKLEQVKATCLRNARPFEYAFLMDALKDEQAQGITIDTARCFFKTQTRDYIIIDAPGHVEFLKNMVSGAARAEAALLVIDAHEGIQENSRRHGYLISMLGISQLVVLVNKMDLVDFSQKTFDAVRAEYALFLEHLGVKPVAFVPLSALGGDNLAAHSRTMPWYTGQTVLEHIDRFVKHEDDPRKPFRMPVQDVYKFTEAKDDRRIVAGTVETGEISVGDEVVFMPSAKKSSIASIEGFNTPLRQSIANGNAAGFRLKDELYLPRGEIMCRAAERLPLVGTRFRANLFWMGRAPMMRDKRYKLKIATARVSVRLVEIVSCIDATDLSNIMGRRQIDRHDVAECILETTRPVAFDPIDNCQSTGCFVIVDNYDIAGGGIIIAALSDQGSVVDDRIHKREPHWDTGSVTPADRQRLFGHKAKFIVITGGTNCAAIAKELERRLFDSKTAAYFLGPSSLLDGLDADVFDEQERREEQVRRLGELARILTDAGTIFITALGDADEYDLKLLARLTAPNEFLHVSLGGQAENSAVDRLTLAECATLEQAVNAIIGQLTKQNIITDYMI